MLSIGDIVKKSQPSLFWCMRNLPYAQREAIYTLFAFCRHIDNVINSPMPKTEKNELLLAWKEEISNIYDKGIPETNIGRKIYKNCLRFNLPKEQLAEIIDSALLDAPNPLQAPTIETFNSYINGMAIVPFRLSLMIIGNIKPSTRDMLAKNLGTAILLTFMLRDIKEDSKDKHMYIPQSILEKANISSTLPNIIIENKNLSVAREDFAKLAEKAFYNAERMLAKMNGREMMPFKFILAVSHNYFDIMKNRGWEIISPKPRLGTLHKISLFIKIMFA